MFSVDVNLMGFRVDTESAIVFERQMYVGVLSVNQVIHALICK